MSRNKGLGLLLITLVLLTLLTVDIAVRDYKLSNLIRQEAVKQGIQAPAPPAASVKPVPQAKAAPKKPKPPSPKVMPKQPSQPVDEDVSDQRRSVVSI